MYDNPKAVDAAMRQILEGRPSVIENAAIAIGLLSEAIRYPLTCSGELEAAQAAVTRALNAAKEIE